MLLALWREIEATLITNDEGRSIKRDEALFGNFRLC